MKIHIVSRQQDSTADDYDALLPFRAEADARGITARGSSHERAISEVKGICLHWLGEFPDPPNHVTFDITREA